MMFLHVLLRVLCLQDEYLQHLQSLLLHNLLLHNLLNHATTTIRRIRRVRGAEDQRGKGLTGNGQRPAGRRGSGEKGNI